MSAELQAVLARLAGLEARVAMLETRPAGGGASTAGASGKVAASDEDLDDEFGDPVLKFDPKKWLEEGGASFAGCRFSQCPSALLLKQASFLEWSAGKAEEENKTYTTKKGEEKPVAPLRRREAALARGWARRNKQTAAPQRPAAAAGAATDDYSDTTDEIPFAHCAMTDGANLLRRGRLRAM